MSLLEKNRNRERPTFANINMLGKCNANCYFCLGKDIEDILCKQNQMGVSFRCWKNFEEFLAVCKNNNIKKIYLTGQNTDPLLYASLPSLVEYLQSPTNGFDVGVRTNGFAINEESAIKGIELMREEIGFSIHTLSPITQKMMLGRADVPEWGRILDKFVGTMCKRARISTVITRCNVDEFYDLMRFLSPFTYSTGIPYVQIRRVSTDTRVEELMPDVLAYERLYTNVAAAFDKKETLWGDADVFDVHGVPCVFWRTVKTTVNSINYFTDGTISDRYFIIEGYLKNRET